MVALAVVLVLLGAPPKKQATVTEKPPAAKVYAAAVSVEFDSPGALADLTRLASAEGAVLNVTDFVADVYRAKVGGKQLRAGSGMPAMLGVAAGDVPRGMPSAWEADWKAMTEICWTLGGRSGVGLLSSEEIPDCKQARGDIFLARYLESQGVSVIYRLSAHSVSKDYVQLQLNRIQAKQDFDCSSVVTVPAAGYADAKYILRLFTDVQQNKGTCSRRLWSPPAPVVPPSTGGPDLGIGRTDFPAVKLKVTCELPATLTFNDESPFFRATLPKRWEASVKDLKTSASANCAVWTNKSKIKREGLGAYSTDVVIVDVNCGTFFARAGMDLEMTLGQPADVMSKRLVESLANDFCKAK